MEPYAAATATDVLSTFEHQELARVAFDIGAKYGGRRFDDHEAAREQWADLARAGIAGLSLPPAFGGGGGGMLELCIAGERLAAGGFPAPGLVLTTGIVASVLVRHGTPEQQADYLPGIADGSTKFCFALTEPDSGSNAMNMKTKIRRDGDDWRLTGQKTYISGVDTAQSMLVVAREQETGGFTLVVLPLPDQRITMSRVEVDMPAFDRQWSVFFDDVRVPSSAIIGDVGHGSAALFDGLNPERLVVGAQAVGIGRWCLERAAGYATTRNVFGVPIGAHQALQHPLAEALISLDAAWALVERAARRYDEGAVAGLESNIAKVAACDAGLLAADRALQTFGGSGYTTDTMILQRFLHMRLLRSIPVSREMALNHIATAGLGPPRSY